MSENASFTVVFVPPGAVSTSQGLGDAYLNLEQIDLNGEKKYQACAGSCLSSGGIFSDPLGAAARLLDCATNCGEENCDPIQKINIKVTKKPQDLPYRLEATYGTLGGKTVEHDNFAKSFDITLDDTLEIETELSQISGRWEGNVYDQYGNIIPKPAISYNSATRTFSWGGEKVVGTLRATGIETFDVWSLNIPPRIDSTTETAWSSTVRAFYMDGGEAKLETLSISEPEQDGACEQNFYTDFAGTPDDEEGEGDLKEKCYKRTIVVDPCTGEIASDTLSEISCPEDEND